METRFSLEDVAKWEYVDDNDYPYLYDITVENNSNYYIQVGDKQILVHNSSKTYSILQFIWYLIHEYKGLDIGICRETTPTLKGTVLKDFIEIGTDLGLYDVKYHNRTDNIYKFNGNVVEFFALDDEGKARGKKRNIIYMNEANRLEWDLAEQILIRTTDKVILDFNPSEIDSWIYDQILIRDTCAFLKTTYKHNPFLSDKILREMEHMRIHNPSKYRVFGLGERAIMEGQIYDNWAILKDEEYRWSDCNVWCMDFGATSDPTVIMRMGFDNYNVYAQELFYGQDVRNHHIMMHLFFHGYNEDKHVLIGDGGGVGAKVITELREGFNMTMEQIEEDVAHLYKIVPDKIKHLYQFKSSEHKRRLRDFLRNGCTNILGAIKGKDSVSGGIQKVKGYKVYLHEDSSNAWVEYSKYLWKKNKDGKYTNVPIDNHNHFMDALRYGVAGKGRQHSY